MPLVNPYIVGNPIVSRNLFFGREDDFAFIRNKVTGSGTGGILVLCGTRRSGKTSILFQIKNGRLGDGYLPVLLDMQSLTVGRDAEFLARLAQEIARTLDQADLHEYVDHIRTVDDETAYREFRSFLDELPSHLGGRQLVLLFDEYEIIESCIRDGKLTPGVLRMLANWLEHEQGMFIIFTGSDKLELRDPRYWQSFLGKALHRRISFLSRNDTLRLIREPVADDIAYDEAAPDLIFELTNGQPFYTQVICQSLVDLLNEEDRREIAASDVGQVVAEIIANPLPHMIFAWSSRDPMERMILSTLAAMADMPGKLIDIKDLEAHPGREGLGFSFDSNRLREAAERLFSQDLLIKDDTGTAYGFKMDLWRQWVRRMHSTWQVQDEISGDEGLDKLGILPAGASGGKKPWRRWATGAVAGISIGLGLMWWGDRSAEDPAGGESAIVSPAVARPDSGWVEILATPAGVLVTANDQVVGFADGRRVRVPAGSTRLQLTHDQHQTWEQSVPVTMDSVTTLKVDLVRETGGIRVVSRPAGLEIYLDGRHTGQRTPAVLSVEVREGYMVELRGAGIIDWASAPFAVTAGDTHTIEQALAAAIYPLSIASTPSDAEISVSGRQVGRSPVQVKDLPAGVHQVQAVLAGHETLTAEVEVPAPGNMVSLVLQRQAPGTLVIKIINTYAEIWVDGERLTLQAVNHQVELSPGVHAVELRNPAFATFRTEIEVASGKTSICEHTFRKGGSGE